MNGILKAPQAAPVQSVNGKTGAVALAAPDVGAMSTWGGAINSGYNSTNGDAYIRRATAGNTGALLMSANTCLYRIVNDAQSYRIFDEGLPPWGGETVTMITQAMVTGCTLKEPQTCTVYSRCGLCFATLSGVHIDANVGGTVTIPYTAKVRSEMWMHDIGGGTGSRLCFIDMGSNIIQIFANPIALDNGYCTLIFALNM